MASAFLLDERSRLRRSQKDERVLSRDAIRASRDNTRKTTANAAGVSRRGSDKVPIVLGINTVFV